MKENARREKKVTGLALEFSSAVLKSLPDLDEKRMKFWISRQGHRGLLTKRLREALGSNEVELNQQFQDMTRFYQEVFDLTVDVGEALLPPKRQGFDWLLLVPSNMTLNRAWSKCQERFKKSWSYYSYDGDDLDRAVPTNERDPSQGTYIIRLRDRVEADVEWKKISANDIANKKISTNTLLERLLLELWYYWETRGNHLDVSNWTLCSGSRDSNGGIPGVSSAGDFPGDGWYGDGEFRVDCCHPDFSSGGCRPREVAVS